MQKMRIETSQIPILTNMENVTTSKSLKETDDVCEYCGKKIMASVFFALKKTWSFKIMCPCVKARFVKCDDELKAREEQNKLNKLFKQSMLGEKFWESTFDNFEVNEKNRHIYNRLKDFAYNFEDNNKKSIIIMGNPGTGKTTIGSCIVNHLVRNSISAVFVIVPDLLDKIRDSFTNPEVSEQKIMNGLLSCKLLVLDDFGVERHKSKDDWANEKLYQLINLRYSNKKSTVFTTNCSWEELFMKYGSRTASRIVEMTGEHMYYMDNIENYRMKNF